jgi:hypothetical protein
LPELGEVVDKLAVAFATAQRALERLPQARTFATSGGTLERMGLTSNLG